MTELRHFKYKGEANIFINPDRTKNIVQEKLQTLSTIQAGDCGFSNIVETIPNLIELGIYFDTFVAADLPCLHKLENLKCSSNLSMEARDSSFNISLPTSLKKLTLKKCLIPSKFMENVGLLPNLKMLKILECNFEDAEWEEPNEGEFCSLQFLVLEKFNLVHWRANETHFPSLRHLIIRKCSALEGIPSGIGEIIALEMIEVDESSPSVVSSAKQIQEEQCDLRNDGLQVCIHALSK